MICYTFCLRPKPLVYSFSFRSVFSCAEVLWSSIHGIMKTGKHRGQLKDQVVSLGGTTIVGIHELENSAFCASMTNAIVAMTKHSHEIDL
ncbi:hypothetical protein ACFX2A_014678 [Malus domestica]